MALTTAGPLHQCPYTQSFMCDSTAGVNNLTETGRHFLGNEGLPELLNLSLIMLSLIKWLIFIYVKTLVTLKLCFQAKPAGDPRGPCGRPGARGHHVGGPCFTVCLSVAPMFVTCFGRQDRKWWVGLLLEAYEQSSETKCIDLTTKTLSILVASYDLGNFELTAAQTTRRRWWRSEQQSVDMFINLR